MCLLIPSKRWPLILFSPQDKFLQLTHSSYYSYSLEINSVEAIKLMGVTNDRELNFNHHVAVHQLQLIKRLNKLIDTKSKIRLHDVDF
mgnify:FL=1